LVRSPPVPLVGHATADFPCPRSKSAALQSVLEGKVDNGGAVWDCIKTEPVVPAVNPVGV